MWNRIRNREDESGQIVVMVAGGLIVLLLIAGLVIDTGVGFRERRSNQNVADLASMAGTKMIADHYLDGGRTGSDVYAAMQGSVQANGCVTADGCTWAAVYVRPGIGPGVEVDLGSVTSAGTIPAGAQGVRVDAASDPGTFFMKVVGISSIHVATEATAMTSGILNQAPSGVLLPIASFDSDFEYGTEYVLTEGYEGPGNFGFLTWNGNNDAGTLAASICGPNNPAMTFPVWVQGAPGNMNKSAVRACLDGWIGQTVLIPIWSQTNTKGGSNLNYEVITLAAFTLTGYDQHASTIRGTFEEFYALPGVPAGYGTPPCNVTSPTCYSRTNFIGLTR